MSTVHVLPLGDAFEHAIPGGLEGRDDPDDGWLVLEVDPDADELACACGPAVELVSSPTAPDGWIVTHHSLDGREFLERTP